MEFLKRFFGREARAAVPQEPTARTIATVYEPGQILCEEYVVRLLLGRGGMGEVYLVEHVSTGELNAAKVMRARTDATAGDLTGFRQEALSLLNMGTHEFVACLFAVREQGRDIVLIMEYVAPTEGCTTAQDYIQKTHDYTDRDIGMWSVQFCVGMEHALAHGMRAHRDIKPSNLLIESGTFLKIADFGLALAANEHPAVVTDLEQDPSRLQWLNFLDGHRICGTPGYIAPELFVGGEATAQSDMFSFGATLWQLAARSMRGPYDVDFQGDASAYQQAVLKEARARAIRPLNSPYFEVICRCLAPDPTQRYPDFPALREAIKNAEKAAHIVAMDFIVVPGFHGTLDDYVNRGRSYLVLGRDARALTILNEAVRRKPDDPAALSACAEAMTRRGQYPGAIRNYEAAHRLDPNSDVPLTGLASAWIELGNFEQARTALDLVLARHPANLSAQLLHARILAVEGHEQEALAEIKIVIATDPRAWRAYEYLGHVSRGLREFPEAVNAFNTCLSINPLALDARLALASLHTSQNDAAAAKAEYEKALSLFQDNPETLTLIGADMSAHGHAAKAIEIFQAIAQSVPVTRSMMLVNIGNAQIELGKLDAAASFYKQAIEIDPSNALAYSRLGDWYYASEDDRDDEAVQCYVRACEKDSDSAIYPASAGSTYLRLKNFGLAKQYLERSLAIYPDQPKVIYNLAVALLLDGDKESAVTTLSKALRIEPEYGRAWYLKAQIESLLGRKADAADSASHAVACSASLDQDELERSRALLKSTRV